MIALLMLVGGCAGTKQAATERQSRLELARAYSAETSGDALLVWIGGDLVLEDYPGGYDPEKPHILTEASVLLSGLMALAAVGDGLLALDEPASETITEWKSDPQKSQITVAELLRLTSGLEPGSYHVVPTYERAIAAPLVHVPGEGFRYGPTAYQAFGAVMERKTGFGYLKRRILEPLGIPGGRWQPVDLAAAGGLHPEAGGLMPQLLDGAHLTPGELGRVGRLLLQGGRWNGEVLIEDIGPLTQPTPASPAYGLGVWLNAETSTSEGDGAGAAFLKYVPERIMLPRGQKRLIYDGAPPDLYMAAGRYNQRLYVLPSENMVVVRLGRANQTWNDAEFLARLLEGRTLSAQARRSDMRREVVSASK